MTALAHSANTTAQSAAVPLLRTLLLCDLVNSTALVEKLGDQRAADLFRKHDRVARGLLQAHGGREIDKTDGFLMMFDRPIQAVAFAIDYQRQLRRLNHDEKAPLAARVGIHVGDVLTWGNTPDDIAKGAKQVEVEGLVKPIASRLMQLALPDQILLSGVTYSLAHRAQGELAGQLAGVRWRTHGRYRFKGIPDPIPVFEVGEEGLAPLKPPPWSGKAHREVPFWRRPATMVIEGVLLLALVAIPVWYVLKPAPAIAFANRDWVVVGDLKNLTGESVFDASLAAAFRIGLEQSRHVNVLSDLKTRETVALMQRDPQDTAIDRAIGSEIAIRDGARALILPTVAEIGGRVRVTAEVVDPRTQTTVYSESADGVGAGSVLPSLDKVNQQLRVRLGEALATVSADSKPLDRVSTKNLDALRAFALGQRAYDTGDMGGAQGLFKQAVKLDADFALAHMMLASIYSNTNDSQAAVREIDAARAQIDRLSARDALYIDAYGAEFDAPATAMEKWSLLSKLYPDYYPAAGSLGYFAWQFANRYDDAIRVIEPSLKPQNSNRGPSEYVLGTLLLGQEQFAAAEQHLERARQLGLDYSESPLALLAAQRRFEAVRARLAGTADAPAPKLDVADPNLQSAMAADQGHFDDAWKLLDAAKAQARERGSSTPPRVLAVEASLRSVLDPDARAMDGLNAWARAEAASAARHDQTVVEQRETEFRILFAAYLAARNGGVEAAREIAGRASASAQSPVLANLRLVLQAELARASGDRIEANRILKRQSLDGTELVIMHVALLDAAAAEGDHPTALREATWLTGHRGRAYTEYNADWVARPFNVAMTNLAWLYRAEHALDPKGDHAEAREALAEFRRAWSPVLGNPAIMARVDRLTARL